MRFSVPRATFGRFLHRRAGELVLVVPFLEAGGGAFGVSGDGDSLGVT